MTDTAKLIAQARGNTPTSELRTLTFELANALEAAEAENRRLREALDAYEEPFLRACEGSGE